MVKYTLTILFAVGLMIGFSSKSYAQEDEIVQIYDQQLSEDEVIVVMDTLQSTATWTFDAPTFYGCAAALTAIAAVGSIVLGPAGPASFVAATFGIVATCGGKAFHWYDKTPPMDNGVDK